MSRRFSAEGWFLAWVVADLAWTLACGFASLALFVLVCLAFHEVAPIAYVSPSSVTTPASVGLRAKADVSAVDCPLIP